MIFIHDYSLDVTGGGDPLTELLDEPVITEYKNERLDLEFTYRADGKHADKIEYFKIISCPCHKSEEELFYIHSIDRSMGGIQVLAKHITYLIDRVPVKGYKGRLTPWNALKTMKENMVESSPIGFYTTLPADLQEFAVGDNETVHTILHDKFFPTYGGISYRRGKDIGITYERGGTTLYQLAKYKNIQDRSWVGDVDDVVTKVYVRAELDKEWVLPKISGERVAPYFDKYGENGHFSVYVKDKDTGEYIDEVMGFTIYDENGHRIRSAETGTVEITKKQKENLAKWQEDLANKRKTLQGHREKKQTEWVQEQIVKTEKAISELEIKIRDFTIGETGRRIFKNARKGKYTLVMTKAPSSYYGDFWTREFTVSDTFSSITFELEKKTKEGATDKLYLYTDKTSPLASKYPVLMVEHYDVHDERIQTQEALDAYAESLFKDDMIDVLFEDFTVEPSDIADDYMLDIGSTLLLYFEAEDVDRRVECVGYTYDPVKERITSYTFGKRRVGIAGVINKAIRKYMGELELRLLERAEGMVAHSQWQTSADIDSVNRAIAGVAGDIHLAVNSITADVGTFDQIFANRIETETIVADLGEFKKIVVDDLEAQKAKIQYLEAHGITTDYLVANYITADKINAKFTATEKLFADYATIQSLNALQANIDTLTADMVTTEKLNAVYGRIDEVEAKSITTEDFEAINAKILEIEAGMITADAIASTYATIESLNAEIARVNNLLADKASITDLTAINANIETLLAWDGRIMTLESASANVAELLAGNLTAENIKAGLIKVGSALIEDGAITNAKIDTASVNRIMIDQANIKSTAILDAFIRNLSAEVITTGTLKAGVIGAGTITVDKLESNIGEKLGIISSEEINIAIQESIQSTVTDKIISAINLSKEGITISGEKVTINGDTHIENATIKSAHIDDGAITNAHIDNAGIDLAKIQHGELFMMTVENGFISKGTAGELVIDGAQIKEASITSAQIVSLDANLINAGTLSVERLEIRGSEKSIVYEINNITGKTQATNVDTINGEVLTPRTITADRIVANTITSNEIKANSITANEMLTGTITAESGILADLVVTTAKIADLAITTAKIKDANITNAKIAKLAVGTANIQDLAVTDAKIANITADKITASWIEGGQIKAGSLTTSVISSDSWKSLDLSSNTSITLAVGAGVQDYFKTYKNFVTNGCFELPDDGWLLTDVAYVNVGGTKAVVPLSSSSVIRTNTMSLSVGDYLGQIGLRCDSEGPVGAVINIRVVNADTNLELYTSKITTNSSTLENKTRAIPSFKLSSDARVYMECELDSTSPHNNIALTRFQVEEGSTRTKYEHNPGTGTSIISMINLDRTGVRIAGQRVSITGDTYIENGIIDNAHISTAGIDFAKIKNVEITSAMISDLTATVTNITTAQIKSATIDWAQITGAKITNAMIDDGTITTAKIANFMLDVGTIASVAIESAQIDGAQIKMATITGAKIKDATITSAKISSLSADKITTGVLRDRAVNPRFQLTLSTGELLAKNLNLRSEISSNDYIEIKDGELRSADSRYGREVRITSGHIAIDGGVGGKTLYIDNKTMIPKFINNDHAFTIPTGTSPEWPTITGSVTENGDGSTRIRLLTTSYSSTKLGVYNGIWKDGGSSTISSGATKTKTFWLELPNPAGIGIVSFNATPLFRASRLNVGLYGVHYTRGYTTSIAFSLIYTNPTGSAITSFLETSVQIVYDLY